MQKNRVREIIENPDTFHISLRGVRIPATILFSDIVGFTYADRSRVLSEDAITRMYLERALEYEEQPPDEAWNAVEVFEKK